MNKTRALSGIAMLLGLSATTPCALAQLANSSFEDLDPSQVGIPEGFRRPAFDGWGEFGNTGVPANIRRNDATGGGLVNSGTFSCLIFGQFNDPNNVAGLFQSMPAAPGDIVEASVFAGHVGFDALSFGNFAAMNIEYRDALGTLIQFSGANVVQQTDPTDVLTQSIVQSVAPDGSASAQIALLFIQPDPIFGAGAAHFDDATLAKVGESSTLQNAGFELEGGNCCGVIAMSNWAEFGRTISNNIQRSSQLVRTGALSAFMFGQFPAPPVENFTGIRQSLPVTEGEQVDAEVYAAHFSGDILAAGNAGFLNLEFYDALGVLIAPIIANEFFDELQPTNTWVLGQTTAAAPAGAVRVHMVMGLRQPNSGAGGIYFDDAAMTISQAPVCCLGNAQKNPNNIIDFDDVLAVLGGWDPSGGISNPNGTSVGDADCNGMVDFNDVITVLGNDGVLCP